mgnify:CR=1 FL=1
MSIRRSPTAVFLAAVLSVGLAACETPVQMEEQSELTFSHLPKLSFNVAKVGVVDNYRSPEKAPNVEHLLPTSPAAGLERWARDRLKAVGKSGTLRLIIEDASVIEATLKKDTSLRGTFTKQQSQRYDFAVRGSLEAVDAGGLVAATANANARRSITVREDITLHERKKIWFETVEKLLSDFDREMERNARRYLVDWLR